jgi:hypothetical protein
MIKEFARAVRAQIQVEIGNYTEDLAEGRCETHEKYKELCGLIRGLRLAEQLLIDLVKKAESDDDDE